MVPFGFNKTGVESRQSFVDGLKCICEYLKFFATTAFDQSAADQVIDGLMPLTIANGAHQTADPRARIWLAESNTTLFKQIEHELEMLQLFDGDGVQLFNAIVKVA